MRHVIKRGPRASLELSNVPAKEKYDICIPFFQCAMTTYSDTINGKW